MVMGQSKSSCGSEPYPYLSLKSSNNWNSGCEPTMRDNELLLGRQIS